MSDEHCTSCRGHLPDLGGTHLCYTCPCHAPVTDTPTNFPTKRMSEPTPDGIAIKTMSHPRNTPLGASLLLEGILPELTPEQINRACIPLAEEIAQAVEAERERIREGVEEMKLDVDFNSSWHRENAKGYNEAIKDVLALLTNNAPRL